ncbi:short-chain dehydrogenase [Rhizocola hellebori]|uniref:Short-chain dehydrogenase n=1 Tax=Rhizocola hellebori TaxID=1392758 RepID=A0A8J3VGT8_9ACTN|nr:SDR family NAD(P)-dependent oxidoreductase [Rhizocola hellebori]GIH05233.1 short-chain dehydrogenase [Rhizocola hellebori]
MVEIASYGPWAAVTGASSGIGRAFAEQLAAAGLNLVLAARSTDRLESLGQSLKAAHGTDYRVITTDLSRPDGASAVIDATQDLDIGLLVSNAGSGRPGRYLDQDLSDLHRRFTLNATAHLELVHAFGRRLMARGRGGIVIVSALGAQHGIPNMAHDAAAKSYALHLGVALHYELAPAGIDVTVMMPGNVDTPIIDALGVDRASLPVRPQPAARAVRETLAALTKNQPILIPGRMMRLMTQLLPRTVSIRMNGKMLAQAASNLAKRQPAAA